MTRRHLPYEGGGNPARGPAREFANEPTSPADQDEFPDVPPGNAPGDEAASRPEDQPDLDDFAARLGLSANEQRDDEPDGSGADDQPRAGLVGAAVAASRTLGATCLTAIADASRRLADRVRPDDGR